MRVFGNIKELFSLYFRTAAGKEVSITPAAQSGTSPIAISIPDVGDSADSLALVDAVQVLTNKKLQDTTTSIVDSVDPTIAIKFDAAGTSTTSTTLRSNKSVNATLDLPGASDWLIGRISQEQGAGRLKNKDLEDDSTAIVDAVDPTKKLIFNAAGTTGTNTTLATAQTANRSVILPDASGTIGLVPAAGVVKSSGTALSSSPVDLASVYVTGVLPNANTTAAYSNTVNTIVMRDSSSNFAAGVITASLSGNASGTAANVTGIVLPANGGTGITNNNAATTTRSGAFAKTETLTGTTSVTYPTTGTLSTLSGAETLTNKLVSSGAVTGPARVNVPTGTTAELTSGLTATGSVGFDTSLDKLSVKTSAGVVTVGSSSGSGSGEINAVLNPSGAENVSDWAVSGAGSPTVSRVATGGPLSPVIPTMIRSAAGSAGAYIYYDLTLPAALISKKLKVEWHQAAPTSGEWKVEMRTQAGVEYALSTDSSGDSLIPAAAGKYSTTFDADTTTTLQLRFVRVTGSGNLDVSNVIIGPGIQPQGAVVGEWQSYTPTVTGMGTGTFTTSAARWRRVGTEMQVRGAFKVNSAGTGSSVVLVTIPSGYTVDVSATPAGAVADSRNYVGTYTFYNGSAILR